MFENVISELILKSFLQGDPKRAWEWMHFRGALRDHIMFDPGIDIDLPIPPRPNPADFNLADRLSPIGGHARIMTEIIAAMGDPDPQPNFPSPIFNKEAKLEAAKNVEKSLEVAMARIKETIASL